MLIIGALFPAIALVLDSVWAAVAGTARQWFTRSPRRLALIGGTGGLVMIGLGVSIAATGRKDLSGQDRDAAAQPATPATGTPGARRTDPGR